jgi:CspA family cold shock protein
VKDMPTGTVKFFNRIKRFGFIAQDDGEDVFVHESGVVSGPLSDNDRVEFEVEEGPRGPKAVKVKKI